MIDAMGFAPFSKRKQFLLHKPAARTPFPTPSRKNMTHSSAKVVHQGVAVTATAANINETLIHRSVKL